MALLAIITSISIYSQITYNIYISEDILFNFLSTPFSVTYAFVNSDFIIKVILYNIIPFIFIISIK